jgi:hypothetical protein
MKYILLFIWIELIIIFATSCVSPRDKRGDWMENLSGRTYEPIDWSYRRSPWHRNYKTLEELKEDWNRVYAEAQEDINKRIQDLEETKH